MSGLWFSASPPESTGGRSRRIRRGAVLTLVFASVLGTGAATGSWGDAFRAQAGPAPDTSRQTPAGSVVNGAPPGGSSEGVRGTAGVKDRTVHGPPGAEEAAEELVSRSGDRWAGAYSPREYEGLRQTLNGQYVGVGISVREDRETPERPAGAHAPEPGDPVTRDSGTRDSGTRSLQDRTAAAETPAVTVARVHPGSPAAAAGIRPGDRLRAVDGDEVAGRPITDVVGRLRGSAHDSGSGVLLRLSRDGHEWTETLRRARLSTDTVDVDRLGDGATRIKVSSFTRGTGAEVRKAVSEQVPHGSGIVLDLRGNAGGLVDEATKAAAAFLDGGLVATYEDRGVQRALYAQHGGDHRKPLVVLVDGGTMSAAEL